MKLRFKLSFFALTVQTFIIIFQLNTFVISPIHGQQSETNSGATPETPISEPENEPSKWQLLHDQLQKELMDWADEQMNPVPEKKRVTYGRMVFRPTTPPQATKSSLVKEADDFVNSSFMVLFKTLIRLEAQHEKMFRVLDAIERKFEEKLGELVIRIDNVTEQTQLNKKNCKKLYVRMNASNPTSIPTITEGTSKKTKGLGWGRFLTNPVNTACIERYDFDYYAVQLNGKLNQLAQNLLVVSNETNLAIQNLSLTNPFEESVSRIAAETKDMVANMFFQLATEWSKRANNSTGQPIARDCLERQFQLQAIIPEWTQEVAINKSGIHQIWPERSPTPFMVFCDFATDNGGWTVLHYRSDSALNFFRDWAEFKAGFGNINEDHWLGLEHIYSITNQAVYELRVELENFEGERVVASYNAFAIGTESEQYQLKVLGQFTGGDAGDALSYHAGMKFSTRDHDNDMWKEDSCAMEHMGGWWYNHCESANLNGLYLNGFEGSTGYRGMFRSEWMGPEYSLKKAALKIRPVKVDSGET